MFTINFMSVKKFYVLLAGLLAVFSGSAQTQLDQYFQNPPNAARPRVWWHWMNGNVTKEGIQKDLDWMKRIGIGGFQNFDANLFTPPVVPQKLVFMTPAWKDAFLFATTLADKNGLEMAIAGSPGWSVTGGPWVPAADGMKKYVWTETRIKGGQRFSGKLPAPAATTGKFQNVALPKTSMLGELTGELPTYYHDALVVACRLLPADKTLVELNPELSASGGKFLLKDLTDGDLNAGSFLPPQAVGEDMWIQYKFDAPQTFKALSLAGAIHLPMEDFRGGPLNRSLKVSDDGLVFREVATLTGSINPQNTVSFAPATAKYWRLAYKTLPPAFNPFAEMSGGNPQAEKPDGVYVAEFVLHPTDRIDQFEDKAGFTPWKEDNVAFTVQNADAIPIDQVIDLTSKMNADGGLEWDAPTGNWVVLRFGYSLTGRQNHPASPEATGLEVDKLDGEAVRKYINTYLDLYKDATGGMMGAKGLQYMVLDSYEAGHMNWTKNMPAEFAKRRGYDLRYWIPVLTGRMVKSAETSEQFLWDFRKTIGEMIVENHYDLIGEELHKRGMKRYTESHEDKRIYLADGMDVKRHSDIPMSAMWTPGSLAGGAEEEVRSEADIRESASVAHIYGKDIVAAESMTSIQNAFTFSPEKLKRTADLEMASGLNRFVIHTSVHQPLDDKMPGFSLGPFGQYFTRQETWAEQAGPWVDYLARSCHMLQQGKFVADVLYYYGENTNITWQFKEKLPDVPAGYAYDFVNATALREAVTVQKGNLVTPGGMSYKLLVLDESARLMTLPVLKKLRDLVRAGAKITGTKPEKSPSMSDNPLEFQSIVNEIWGSPNVLKNQTIGEALQSLAVKQDLVVQQASAKVMYVHRADPVANIDLYWLNNRSAEPNNAELSFRISGKTPERWNPQTGKTEKVSYVVKDGRTIISLRFESWDACFIVFRQKTNLRVYNQPAVKETPALALGGPWTVKFQKERGAPENATFDRLSSWSEHADPGIKYFSGTAVYQNTFKMPALTKDTRYAIDLGMVKNLAEVIVNGKNMGICWKQPFKLDITDALKAGENQVDIKVTNLWANRLIGDAQLSVKNKITFTTMPFYKADAPLLPSGLLGEVSIIAIR